MELPGLATGCPLWRMFAMETMVLLMGLLAPVARAWAVGRWGFDSRDGFAEPQSRPTL